MTALAINHDALKGATHPIRARFLEILAEATEALSPTELSLQVDCPIGLGAYHVRMLHQYGLVTLERTEPRRGALQHFYAITAAGRVSCGAIAAAGDDGDAIQGVITAARALDQLFDPQPRGWQGLDGMPLTEEAWGALVQLRDALQDLDAS